MIQARVRIGKGYAASQLPGFEAVWPAYRSDEIVVACGKRDRNGQQTCGGDFGALDMFAEGRDKGPRIALWGIFRFEAQREAWRPTNYALKQGNRGATPGLRRAVVLRPTTRGGAHDRARHGVHAQGSVRYQTTDEADATASRRRRPYATASSEISERQRVRKSRRCSASDT